MKLKVKVEGIDDVLDSLGRWASEEKAKEIDKVSETYARKMAAESAGKAPIKDGALKGSIAASPQPGESLGEWTYGSDLPYARRQEYEHATNKGFIREVVWNNRDKYREAVRKRVIDD